MTNDFPTISEDEFKMASKLANCADIDEQDANDCWQICRLKRGQIFDMAAARRGLKLVREYL